MGLLYDLIMLIIVIMFCIIGAGRGIVRSIVLFITLIVSLLIGYVVSGIIAEPVYESFVKDKAVNAIKDSVEDFDAAEFVNEKFFDNKLGIKISDAEIEKAISQDGSLSENISEYAESKGIALSSGSVAEKIDSVLEDESVINEVEKALPSYAAPLFESALSNEKDMMESIIKSLVKTDKTLASEEIADNVLKHIVMTPIRIVLFILCFIAAWIILRLIVAVTRLGKNREKSALNTVLGGALGIIKGLILAVMITVAVSVISPIISAVDSNSMFNVSESAINNSIFLRCITDIIN